MKGLEDLSVITAQMFCQAVERSFARLPDQAAQVLHSKLPV